MENETVRKELGIERMSEKMRENRLRWLGHVWRSEEQGLSKRVMGLKAGRRSRGRPKRRFVDCIEDLKIKGLEVTDAEDSELWRRTIHTGDPDLSGEARRRRRRSGFYQMLTSSNCIVPPLEFLSMYFLCSIVEKAYVNSKPSKSHAFCFRQAF